MSEEDVDNHVLRKYSLLQKLGKGVRLLLLPWHSFALDNTQQLTLFCLQAYGVVWKAVDKKNQNLVALKKIFDAFQNATDAQVRHACQLPAAMPAFACSTLAHH
jgi:mitogen-activated protein kinase 15